MVFVKSQTNKCSFSIQTEDPIILCRKLYVNRVLLQKHMRNTSTQGVNEGYKAGLTADRSFHQNLRFSDFFSASVISSKKWFESVFSFSRISFASETCIFRPARETAAGLPYLEMSRAVLIA